MAKKLFLSFIFLLFSQASWSSTLDEFSPREATHNPWSDAWYYYIHDPKVGYYKIVFLTYLNEETPDNQPHAYVHVVLAAKDGSTREYDYYFNEVVAKPVAGDSEYAFSFEIPGVASINEKSIALDLPDVSIKADFSADHLRYSTPEHPNVSPFAWLTSLPFVENQWFVFSMATPAQYQYRDAEHQYQGSGLTYIDRGWNSGQAAGMVYLMAVSEELKLMLSGGTDGKLPMEIWAGRLISEQHDLTFTPSINGMAAHTDFNPCEGKARVEMQEGDYRILVQSAAPLASFYNHVTPSLSVFHSKNPVMKSMQATATVEIYKDETLLDSITLEQSVLEFGGLHYCDKIRNKGLAAKYP